VSDWYTALGALLITLSIAAGALLSRWLAPMTGATDIAWCPAEQCERLHAFLATGGRICWTCRHFTDHGPLTSAPAPGGAE
jgi:hypothetical protein